MTDQDIIRTLKRAGFSIIHNRVIGPQGAREVAAIRRDTLNVVGAQVIITTPTVYDPEYEEATRADIRVDGRTAETWWGWTDIRERIGRL